jgi:hypothetical protein
MDSFRVCREVCTRIGDRVEFQIASAFLPSPDEVMASLAIGSVVEGTVVEFSDSGQRTSFFAVVEVVRRRQIVVPVEKLVVVTPPKDFGG